MDTEELREKISTQDDAWDAMERSMIKELYNIKSYILTHDTINAIKCIDRLIYEFEGDVKAGESLILLRGGKI